MGWNLPRVGFTLAKTFLNFVELVTTSLSSLVLKRSANSINLWRWMEMETLNLRDRQTYACRPPGRAQTKVCNLVRTTRTKKKSGVIEKAFSNPRIIIIISELLANLPHCKRPPTFLLLMLATLLSLIWSQSTTRVVQGPGYEILVLWSQSQELPSVHGVR